MSKSTMNTTKRRKKLDPKILDDSSEDSSKSSSEISTEQIGPSLPPTDRAAEPSEQTRASITTLPIHNETQLGSKHTQYTSCLSLEPSGNRLVTGSLDATAKLWDFNAMPASQTSFRTFTPITSCSLRTAQFSPTGSNLLLSGNSPHAIVADRDGHEVQSTPRGDMYLSNTSLTHGHTTGLSSAVWPSRNSSLPPSAILTAGHDATVRVWDVGRTRRTANKSHMLQTSVFRLRTSRGARAVPTALDWAGRRLALGCSDGRLRLLDPGAPTHTACASSEAFAPMGTEVSGVACARGVSSIVVRSCDDGMHVFDERRLGSPLVSFTGLENRVSETGVVFVGTAFVMTATSAGRSGSGGGLRMFCLRTMKEVWRMVAEEGCGSLVSLIWHEGINQVVYGCGEGGVHVMFHDAESERGVLPAVERGALCRRVNASVSVSGLDADERAFKRPRRDGPLEV